MSSEAVGLVEGHRPPGVAGLHGLEHLVLADLQPLGDLADGGRALQHAGQRGDRVLDVADSLLEPARDAKRPDAVAEVAAEFAEDRGPGERRERDAARGVEPLQRAHQADAGYLHQVVGGLGAAGVAHREATGERQEAVDEFLAQRGIARLGESPQQLVLLREALRRPRRPAVWLVFGFR